MVKRRSVMVVSDFNISNVNFDVVVDVSETDDDEDLLLVADAGSKIGARKPRVVDCRGLLVRDTAFRT